MKVKGIVVFLLNSSYQRRFFFVPVDKLDEDDAKGPAVRTKIIVVKDVHGLQAKEKVVPFCKVVERTSAERLEENMDVMEKHFRIKKFENPGMSDIQLLAQVDDIPSTMFKHSNFQEDWPTVQPKGMPNKELELPTAILPTEEELQEPVQSEAQVSLAEALQTGGKKVTLGERPKRQAAKEAEKKLLSPTKPVKRTADEPPKTAPAAPASPKKKVKVTSKKEDTAEASSEAVMEEEPEEEEEEEEKESSEYKPSEQGDSSDDDEEGVVSVHDSDEESEEQSPASRTRSKDVLPNITSAGKKKSPPKRTSPVKIPLRVKTPGAKSRSPSPQPGPASQEEGPTPTDPDAAAVTKKGVKRFTTPEEGYTKYPGTARQLLPTDREKAAAEEALAGPSHGLDEIVRDWYIVRHVHNEQDYLRAEVKRQGQEQRELKVALQRCEEMLRELLEGQRKMESVDATLLEKVGAPMAPPGVAVPTVQLSDWIPFKCEEDVLNFYARDPSVPEDEEDMNLKARKAAMWQLFASTANVKQKTTYKFVKKIFSRVLHDDYAKNLNFGSDYDRKMGSYARGKLPNPFKEHFLTFTDTLTIKEHQWFLREDLEEACCNYFGYLRTQIARKEKEGGVPTGKGKGPGPKKGQGKGGKREETPQADEQPSSGQ